MRSRVTYQGQRSCGLVVRYAGDVKFTSFEKLKSEWNQAWFIGTLICS